VGRLGRCFGPEFIAATLHEWIAAVGSQTAYIEPESPRENGYCESFNSKLRMNFSMGRIGVARQPMLAGLDSCLCRALGYHIAEPFDVRAGDG
jgi:hypothetical protein